MGWWEYVREAKIYASRGWGNVRIPAHAKGHDQSFHIVPLGLAWPACVRNLMLSEISSKHSARLEDAI